jgi:Tol biopolymer transport system component
MNKEILNQIPADEQPIASKLQAVAEDMQLSPTFQWELEHQLMEKYKAKNRPVSGWFAQIMPTLGWAFAAICALFLLNWAIRSLVPNLSAASGETSTPASSETSTPTSEAASTPGISFEADIRAGNICGGPLALQHNTSVALSNEDKTRFIALDQKTVGQMLDFAWSPDGRHLAIVGQNVDGGNIYLTDSTGAPLQPVLSEPVHLNLNQVTWSPDGTQLLANAIPSDDKVYLMNIDGTGFVTKHGETFFLTLPQFTPDGKSIIYQGTASGKVSLYEATLDGSKTQIISNLSNLEKGGNGFTDSFAYSPDRTHLAYVDIDLNLGEAQLVLEDTATGSKTVLGTVPFSDRFANRSNLSWSPDGKSLVFEFRSSASDRAVFLAHTDGSGLVELADDAHTPAISPDGRCLAYISHKQVFVLDLVNASLPVAPITPVLLADIPTALSTLDFSKLQWAPSSAEPSSTSDQSFEDNVRAGNICAGPLAVGHDFAISLTNHDKTGFVLLEEQETIGELRGFAWSPDGTQLAAAGFTLGSGNIYLTDSAGAPLQPVLPKEEADKLGLYLNEVAWSPDGQQLLSYAIPDNSTMYLMNIDGTSLVKKQFDQQIYAMPQFTADGRGIIYVGADSSAGGLFESMLDGSQSRVINALVGDDGSGFALSPDGSHLAYIEMHRDLAEARLVVEDVATGNRSVLGTIPTSKNSSAPGSAHLSWSQDGKLLTFEFGKFRTQPADTSVYLAHADRTGLIRIADAAHAPAISADGNCLAYVSKKQVFLVDLHSISSDSPTAAPMLLADLPEGKSATDFRGDQLQWAPGEMTTAESSFEDNVRAGNICTGPLALAYNLSVALTNQDKSGYIILDEQKTIGELRDFAWSPDGTHLAVAGRSNIYLTDSVSAPLQPIFSDSERPGLYLNGVTWSPDGKQLIIQTIENYWAYLTNIDGDPAVRIQPSKYVLSKPQFTPNNKSIIYYGADSDSSGLLETTLDGSQTRLITELVESSDWSGFALSPDGSRLAYMEIDHNVAQDNREARLIVEQLATGEKSALTKFSIPEGTGAGIPDASNMSWSADGKVIVFELRLFAGDRATYLAYTDGTGLVKLADWGHAPTISADGNCLAYINNKQLFVLDLSQVSLDSPAPLRLADLPAGASYIEQMQWRPGIVP